MAFTLSACTIRPKLNDDQAESTTQPTQEKQGETTKTGVIKQVAGKYYLEVVGEALQDLDTYTVDLSQYAGKTVTVTGQFSGDTLFVGKVE